MPCSTLLIDIGRPTDVISGSADDVSGSPTKSATTRHWLPMDSCPLVASVPPTPPTGGAVTRIPLPDVNGPRSFPDAATTTSGSAPTSGSYCDGQSARRAPNPPSSGSQSGTTPPSSSSRQRAKRRRKKARSRDKARNRKKKPQPEEGAHDGDDGQPIGEQSLAPKRRQSTRDHPLPVDAAQKTPSRGRRSPDRIAVPSGRTVATPGGSPGAPISRAVSVQEHPESCVRLPRIGRARDDVVPSRSTELSLKKCASNPEISPKGGAVDADQRKAGNHVINKQPMASTQVDDGKKKPQVALLVAIKPENQDSEREKFFKQRYNYNPQFTYRYPANPVVLERYSHPTNSLLPVAEKIMNHAIKKYGSFEKFVETTGGKKLNRSQIVDSAKKYLKKEGMLDEVSVRLSEDILSRACMTRFRGQPTLQVRINEIRELWMEGLLRHELGTHYIRSSNNRNQEWYKWRRRRELNLRPFNPTEEGIAALHSIISRPEPSLFRSALLYYTAFKASQLPFSDLFKDLAKFVKDPHVRWDYCMRAKRGQTDTSQPGTFSKDQVYLTGALSILKHRSNIDFHALFRCGKVDYRDVERLKDLADLRNTRIPGFMVDLKQYRRSLDEIVIRNGLTDSDLEAAV